MHRSPSLKFKRNGSLYSLLKAKGGGKEPVEAGSMEFKIKKGGGKRKGRKKKERKREEERTPLISVMGENCEQPGRR